MDYIISRLNFVNSCILQFTFNQASLFVLGFVGHFVSSPREGEKNDRRDSRGYERKRQKRKQKMNESEETEEIIASPTTLTN